MRIAFVYPGIMPRGYSSYTYNIDDDESFPILAISLLAGVAVSQGHEVELLDLRQLLTEEHLENRLRSGRAQVIAVTVQTPSFNVASRVAELAKHFGKITVAGGIHATVAPQDFHPALWDHVVCGEGEIAFADLLNRLQLGEPVNRIIQSNILEDLDSLPLPHYFHEWSQWYSQWYGIEVTRGCVGRCVYCVSGQKKYYKKIRSRSDEHVLSEIEHAWNNFHSRTLAFTDVNSTSNIKRFNGLLLKVLDRYPDFAISIQSRADTFNEETARIIAQFRGGGLVWFGFESASPRILQFLNKNSNPSEERNAVELCKQYGIRFAAMFIIGVPSETDEDVLQSYDFAAAAKPDILCVNICSPFPGTPLYEYCQDHRLLPRPVSQERFHIYRIFQRGLLLNVDYENVRYWHARFHLNHRPYPLARFARLLLPYLPKKLLLRAYHLLVASSAAPQLLRNLVKSIVSALKDWRRTARKAFEAWHSRGRVRKVLKAKSSDRFAILGTAWQARALLSVAPQLSPKCAAILDPDVRHWGECIMGIDVYSPQNACNLNIQTLLVVDRNYKQYWPPLGLGRDGEEIDLVPIFSDGRSEPLTNAH